MHPWKHYIAIGDSFTEGIGDPVDGFQSIGCMERLGQILKKSNPNMQFTNLAKRGLVISEIRDGQLVQALELKPDFITVVIGANDIMKGKFASQQFEEDARSIFEPLSKTGALVSTGTLPPFPFIKTLPEVVQPRLFRHVEKANSILTNLAKEYGFLLVDAYAHVHELDEQDWSADKVHLNARGYFKFTDVMIDVIEKHTGVEIGKAELP